MSKPDFIIAEQTGVYWPGILPYRGWQSRQGYATREEAESRARVIAAHYAKKYGKAGSPDLRVWERRASSPGDETAHYRGY